MKTTANSNNLKVNPGLLKVVAVLQFLLLGLFYYTQWQQISLPSILNYTVFFVFLFAWLLVLADLLQQRIYQKWFWYLGLFTLPFLAILLYAFQRKSLLHLKENSFSK